MLCVRKSPSCTGWVEQNWGIQRMTRTSVVHCNPKVNCQKRAAIQLGKCVLVAEVFMLPWQFTRHGVKPQQKEQIQGLKNRQDKCGIETESRRVSVGVGIVTLLFATAFVFLWGRMEVCEGSVQGEEVIERAVTGGVKYMEPVHCFTCAIAIAVTCLSSSTLFKLNFTTAYT